MAVKKELFIKSMSEKWAKRGMSVSVPLRDAWSILCNTLNLHLHGDREGSWSVLPLPTGTGKTEGLISYCAELSRSSPQLGLLIVTKFTEEADRIAEGINTEAGREVALSVHTKPKLDKRPKGSQLKATQILVITHSKYKKSLAQEVLRNSGSLRKKYTSWLHGERLVVVDEVLRVDEPITVDFDEVRLARYSIPLHIEQQYPQEIKRLELLIEGFFSMIRKGKAPDYFWSMDWNLSECEVENLNPLLDALNAQNSSDVRDSFGNVAMKISNTYRKEVLKNLDDIASLQGYFKKVGNKYALTAVRMLMPSEMPNAVILDATARHNIIYRLLGNFVEIVDVPKNVRSYKNVTLHLMYGINVGKSGLARYGESEIASFYKEGCGERIKPPDTLFCTHKVNLDKFKNIVHPWEEECIVNWGNIDGKNNWASKPNMVICGLPYLGQAVADNVCLCLDYWRYNRGFQYHEDDLVVQGYEERGQQLIEQMALPEMPEDYWREYEKSQMAVSIIQAINRVRCRQIIDDEGGCAETDIYMFLDKECGRQREFQEHIIECIKEAMPEIQFAPKIDLIACNNKTDGLTTQERHFVEVLSRLDIGEHKANIVLQEAVSDGISESTVRRCLKILKSEVETPIKQGLKELGISYVSVRGPKGSLFIRE